MITAVKGKGQVEMFSLALSDLVRYGYGGLRGISPSVSEGQVRGIPAIARAARLRSEAVASLRLRCWKGEATDRQRMDTSWQGRLFARANANEYQDRFDFWETVEESLAYRNNAYIWKNTDPLTFQVIEWWALHPDQVKCKGAGKYEVTCQSGYVDPVGKGVAVYRVDYETILHIRGHGQGGTWEAPSPIQVFRDALSGPIERQRYESKLWTKGTALKLSVSFPQNVSKEQAAQWRDDWKQTYEGTDGETTAVVGGGAEIKPIGMTAKDAEFVAMAGLTVDDAARIMGVPANLLGQKTADGQVPNLEQDLATWFRFGLEPELTRIETALESDYSLFPILGRTLYPRFDSEGFIRADAETEDKIAHDQVQDGRLLVDEWRAAKGLKPLPGGVGKIPQIVPVGGAPNPSNNGSNNGSQTPA